MTWRLIWQLQLHKQQQIESRIPWHHVVKGSDCLGVKTSGCSGYMYTIDFADETTANDQVFEGHGAKVIIDNDSLGYLDGTEVDYGREGLNEAFRFNNPNATAECGCGESFTV